MIGNITLKDDKLLKLSNRIWAHAYLKKLAQLLRFSEPTAHRWHDWLKNLFESTVSLKWPYAELISLSTV